MIVELGHLALILALLLAALQGGTALAGAHRGWRSWTDLAERAAFAQALALILSFAALTHAYVTSDFSVLNVWQNSHSLKPMLYKVTGVWGNHEGSLLLWVLVLALFGAAVVAFGRDLPAGLRARVVGVQGLVGLGFLAFTVFTSNPFLRLDPAPADGTDLNPLLQDPGLAFHPPFLYLGYVGLSVAFSFAVAALIEGRVDPAWARWVRPWTLAAWICLTLGIGLGSWWAYYELGWGGWWFWDPVENVSFMPWLAATALLHSAIVMERRDTLKSWTILLAILAFSLSLLGTFIVRSGILTSVHAFAVDPARGVFILALLGVATGGALALYAWRAPRLAPGGSFAPVSREGMLILNNLLLCTALATVLIGTLYPLFLEAVTGEVITVGPPFFNATFNPLMVPLVLLVSLGTLMPWKRGDLLAVLGRLKLAGLVTIAITGLAAWLWGLSPVMAIIAIAMAAWLICGVLADLAERTRLFRGPIRDSWARLAGIRRSTIGMWLAHGGLGLAIAGMAGSAGFMTERILVMAPGDSTEIAGYRVTFTGMEGVQGPNYQAEQGRLVVDRGPGSAVVATLTPEKRFYPVAEQMTTEAAIHTNWVADLYAVLGDADADRPEARVIRLYHHPLVPWIWIGALVTSLGGLVSLADRRVRVGAPRPAPGRVGDRPAGAAA